MGKQIDQIISKDWSKAIWELNRILAKIQGELSKVPEAGVGGVAGTVVATPVVQNVVVEKDETLDWVL